MTEENETEEAAETGLVKKDPEPADIYPRSQNLSQSVDELHSATYGLLQSVRSQISHLEDEIKRLKKVETKLTTPHV